MTREVVPVRWLTLLLLRVWICACIGLFATPAAVGATGQTVLCEPGVVRDGETALIRCRPEVPQPVAAEWAAAADSGVQRCPSVPAGARLPTRTHMTCGTQGDEVWFWRSVEPVERGALRYRSWYRGDVWRIQAEDLLPARLLLQQAPVALVRWRDPALLVAERYDLARRRSWLGGAVTASAADSIRVTEMGERRLSDLLLEENRRLSSAGWTSGLSEVEILTALRPEAVSGRSDPRRIAMEVGASAAPERILEVFRHELAHQLVGGSVRLMADGDDVGWFLEGFAEYLGFAMVRETPEGRAALLRRFAAACGEMGGNEPPSDYDLGFLYASAADGALWRAGQTSLAARLRAMGEAHQGEAVFGARSDFRGTDARGNFFDELLAGVDAADRAQLEGMMQAHAQPDPAALASELGLALRTDSVSWRGVPVTMRERRDGLFEVAGVARGFQGLPLGVARGDLVWPLGILSGPTVPQTVVVEVARAGRWQRVRLPTAQGQQQRWRVAAAAGVEANWFGRRGGQPAGGAP